MLEMINHRLKAVEGPYLQKPFDHVFLSFKGRNSLNLGQQKEKRLAVFRADIWEGKKHEL